VRAQQFDVARDELASTLQVELEQAKAMLVAGAANGHWRRRQGL